MDIYNSGTYLENNPTWHEEDADWKAAHVLQILRKNDISPATMCEVGCGVGGVVSALARELPDVRFQGFDISSIALDRAKEKSSENLHFQQGSPFESETKFDVALALDVFEHVEDYFSFLRNMREISTYQIYNVPLDLSVRSMVQSSILADMRERIGHLHYFNKDTALATLRGTGHKIIDHFYSSKTLLYSEVSPPRWPLIAIRKLAYGISPDLAVSVIGGFALTVLCE